MGKEKTKEEIIKHKKVAIRKINALCEEYITLDNPASLKKVDLLSYWLEEYSSYIHSEDSFDSNKLIRYNRGNVVRVNFGFNVGKELGGLHLAVVLDNDNKRNADVITVVPLSSTEGKSVHPRSVDLGTELYEKISSHHEKMMDDANKQSAELSNSLQILSTTINLLKSAIDGPMPIDDFFTKLSEAEALNERLTEKQCQLTKTVSILKRNSNEIDRLKLGSMAVTNQITTVSKQRIYVPKRSTDFLYGISLSSPAMDKINEKLKELYFF